MQLSAIQQAQFLHTPAAQMLCSGVCIDNHSGIDVSQKDCITDRFENSQIPDHVSLPIPPFDAFCTTTVELSRQIGSDIGTGYDVALRPAAEEAPPSVEFFD